MKENFKIPTLVIFLFLFLIVFSKPVFATSLNDGLVLYLRFDEGGGSKAYDSSNGNYATIYRHTQLIANWLGANSYDKPIYGSGDYRVSQSLGPFLKNGTITGSNNLILKMYKVGNPTGNFTIRFSTARDSGGVTISYPAENLPTSASDLYFTLPQAKITEGVTYYITVEYTGGDPSNYIVWRYGNNRDWASGMGGYAWFVDTANTSYDMSVELIAKTIGWRKGIIGTSVDFDGHNTCVTPSTPINLTGDKTVVAWVYPRSYRMGIAQTTDASWGKNGWAFATTNGGLLKLRIGNGTQAEEKYSTLKIELDKWNFVAMIYDSQNDKVTFYVNDKNAGTSYYTTILDHVGGSTGTIGNEDCFSGEMVINGLLDEIRIYNRTLTEGEIKTLYNLGGARIGLEQAEPTGKVLDINFDLINGNQVIDTSGNENHGTIYGAVQKPANYCKVGRCLEFDGIDDYAEIPLSPELTMTTNSFTVMAWLKAPQVSTSRGNLGIIGNYRTSTTPFWNLFLRDANTPQAGQVSWYLRDSGGAESIIYSGIRVDDNKWHHIAAVRKAGVGTYLYIDGILVGTSSDVGDVNSGQNIWIGNHLERFWKFSIDQIKIFNRALSQEEIIKEMGLPPQQQGLVLHLTFDEGGGDITKDLSMFKNHGRLKPNETAGPKWVDGISGSALSFDGVDDYVRIDNITQLKGSKEMTLCYWVKYTNPSAYDLIGYIDANNHAIRLGRGNDGNIFVNAGEHADVYTGIPLPTNKWLFLCLTGRVGDKWIAYLNGEPVYSGTRGLPSTSYYSIPYFGIGASIESSIVHHVSGTIDEVRIYNRALTPAEIKALYAQGLARIKQKQSQIERSLKNGLVLNLDFDRIEACGQSDTITCPLGMSGLIAVDKSGNANHGMLANGPAIKSGASCKYGRCLQFDGIDDYVYVKPNSNLTQEGSNAITVAAWINIKNPRYGVINGRPYWILHWGGTTLPVKMKFYVGLNGAWNSVLSNTAVSSGWHLWVGVYDGSYIKIYLDGKLDNQISASGLISSTGDGNGITIGCDYYPCASGRYNKGIIDEVRVYNRALTPAEIWYLYTHGKPVGEWRFEEGSGTIAHDTSGQGNDGTIYGATWTNGKFGKALQFDGVDDYVDLGAPPSLNITGPITVEAWIYPKISGKSQVFVGAADQYVLWVQSNNEVRFADTHGNYVDTDPNVLTLNAWNHVVGVFYGKKGDPVTLGNAKIFINGISKGTHTGGTWSPTGLTAVNIGRWVTGSSYFNGTIDEVKIYPFALTPGQIKAEFAKGAWRIGK